MPSEEHATEPSTTDTLLAVVADLLVVLLPLGVLLLVHLLAPEDAEETLFTFPEWSFAAAVLFGHTVVKFVSGIVRQGGGSWERLSFVATAVLVLGFVPSLVVMVLVVTREHVPILLAISQLVLLLLGMLTFLVLGGVGHHTLFSGRERR